VFRTEAKWRAWNKSEGARKRSAHPWTNWGRELDRYANAGEGSSSDGSSRAPRLPIAHNSDEEEAVVAQRMAISEAEARARFRREEADAVR
jgi:hypothetical protein